MTKMRCALAAVGFINGAVEYNKSVLADALEKCAGRADVVIFGEAFLQGFDSINFTVEHDMAVSVSHKDHLIREICGMAKKNAIAVSFGFIEKEHGTFFSSQMTIDKNGRMIDLYRRVSPGWKKSFAGKEYREGSGFHTFHFLDKKVAIGLCGDLWYEENITRLNEAKPDIIWWPVYTDYNELEWNNTVKCEYAKQAGKINAPVFYVNSVCMEQSDDRESAKGGAALFAHGSIREELPAGKAGILIAAL